MHWGTYGWGMGYGWIFMILFWAVVAVVIAYVVRAAARTGCRTGEHEGPLDIAKKRYARGEITREEYELLRDDLKKT